MQERKLQEIKMQAAFAGVDLDGKNTKDKKSEAEAKMLDPLKDFPNDIDYLKDKDCNVKIRLTNDPKLSLPFEQKWNIYRKDCCLGVYGPEAKRCSMNDVLWGRYINSVEVGKPLILDAIKAMVEFDMARRELYPVNYKGIADNNPPPDYIKELKASGKYMEIVQKLSDISKRLQKYGTS